MENTIVLKSDNRFVPFLKYAVSTIQENELPDIRIAPALTNDSLLIPCQSLIVLVYFTLF